MKIYIDSNFRCHTMNTGGNLREIETDFFVFTVVSCDVCFEFDFEL